MNRALGCKKKAVIDPRDYLFEDLEKKKAMSQFVPIAFNLKDKFPAVYDQGQSGTCTSCAVLACDDYYNHAPKGKGWIPSWKFTYYNQKKPDDLKVDDGSNVERALKIVRKYGACNSKVWPNDSQWNLKPSEEAYKNGLKGREITTFHRLKNMHQLKQAISNGYPVPASIVWAFRDYDENFIMNTPTKKEIKQSGNHAIVIVGYDDETGLIEIRNSWSAGWCNDGYGYITQDVFVQIIDWSDTYAVVR